MKKKVLFLCSGNSCRSQIAEGMLRQFYGDQYEVYSAGINPREIDQNAIEVMKEIGIDISHQFSKSVDQFLNQEFDIVITLCDRVEKACPTFSKKSERLFWDIIDPAEGLEHQAELLEFFREIRDTIHNKVKEYFSKDHNK